MDSSDVSIRLLARLRERSLDDDVVERHGGRA